ncbi:MAG: glycerophosphodiester phosphodiesterase family protein [Clostridia bacterium]|nr:glycerophosphodiester phosphodiesterase family protein [Clostridia bacterium]
MKTTIQEAAKQRILLAAHRGVSGGNIPCNTLAAYEIALRQGADIVEIDVSVTKDHQLYVFHPGMEPSHLRSQNYLKDLCAEEVDALRFVNQDGVYTTDIVSRLDDVLALIKGRAFVNIDKFWTAIPEITDAVRRHGMQNDVIVKTSADTKWFDMVEEIAPDLPYMPIISDTDNCTEALLKRKINFIGAEVLFKTEDAQTAQQEYIADMHKKGLLLWANAIVYNYKAVLTGGHSDDVSLTKNPDDGWGWLADRGYDIIQTDWTLAAKLYLDENNKRFRS